MKPEHVLATVAVAIGQEEFERTGRPATVRPRHFLAARAALEAASSAIYVQGAGARERLKCHGSQILAQAADAPGPDQDALDLQGDT